MLFQQTDNPAVYNLSFGDVDEITGEINDISISNNNDSQKVLATVENKLIMTLFLFEKFIKLYIMKVATKNTRKSPPARAASKTKVIEKSGTVKEAPFIKKKMAKANKILSIAPLPK